MFATMAARPGQKNATHKMKISDPWYAYDAWPGLANEGSFDSGLKSKHKNTAIVFFVP